MSIQWIRKELENQYRDLVEDLCLISEKEAGDYSSPKRRERSRAIQRVLQLTKIHLTLISGEIIDTDLGILFWDDNDSQALIIPGTTTQSLRFLFPNSIATFEILRPSDEVLDQQYEIAKELGITKPDEA
jgi:hypothetical protein